MLTADASCLLVSEGVVLVLFRFCGPLLSSVCRLWHTTARRDTLWRDLCQDRWFSRRCVTVTAVPPGAAAGCLVRIVRRAACTGWDLPVSFRQTYARLSAGRVRTADVDAMELVDAVPAYGAGDAALFCCIDRPIARRLGRVVVFLEPEGEVARVALMSSDTTSPLATTYTLTLTHRHRTLAVAFEPCHVPGVFAVATLPHYPGPTLVHVAPVDRARPPCLYAQHTRPFAPLDLDPALS